MMQSFFIAILTVFGQKITAPATAVVTDGADFVYFDRQDLHSIAVPFGLNGACQSSGVVLLEYEGVLIDDVQADGHAVRVLKGIGTAHDRPKIIIRKPGPNFSYRMGLDDLTSDEPGTNQSRQFVLGDNGPLPDRLEIVYRIRCADGSLSTVMRTHGVKCAYPKSQGKTR
jgi:hypothetical protein